MAWIFGDSFDLYAAVADATVGYWDSSSGASPSLVSGRFTGSRALSFNSGGMSLVKSSGANDAVHHVVCAFQQTAALSGTTLGCYFSFGDGATAQCSIVFRSDGAVLLTSGGPTGTTLATYTGAITANNTWYAFEFEVVINNTTGSFTVRKNGNTSNDFTLGSLNTRGGTANNYANRLTMGMQASVNTQCIDDMLWRSDATSGSGLATWVGDIRCYTRMPASDVSKQFVASPSQFAYLASSSTANTVSLGSNRIVYYAVSSSKAGALASIQVNLSVALTGNMVCALYDATGPGGGPGALLATSAQITNPPLGVNNFSVSGGPLLAAGNYWLAILNSASTTVVTAGITSFTIYTQTYTYSTTLPSTATGVANSGNNQQPNAGFTINSANFSMVNEAQQDAGTTYVFDSTPGDADFYNIASIPTTPVSTIAVTTRGFMEKSDAGARTGAVQLKSGSTIVASPTLSLNTTWGWAWRTDTTDPATSAAWTATGVNNAQIGPTTIS